MNIKLPIVFNTSARAINLHEPNDPIIIQEKIEDDVLVDMIALLYEASVRKTFLSSITLYHAYPFDVNKHVLRTKINFADLDEDKANDAKYLKNLIFGEDKSKFGTFISSMNIDIILPDMTYPSSSVYENGILTSEASFTYVEKNIASIIGPRNEGPEFSPGYLCDFRGDKFIVRDHKTFIGDVLNLLEEYEVFNSRLLCGQLNEFLKMGFEEIESASYRYRGEITPEWNDKIAFNDILDFKAVVIGTSIGVQKTGFLRVKRSTPFSKCRFDFILEIFNKADRSMVEKFWFANAG